MAIPCVKVASGGLPVTVASGAPFEISPSGYGIAVTVVALGGLPITDATPGGGLGGSGGGSTYATWDTATATSVTLSGGNLVATQTGTTANNQGAHVVSTSGKTSGKYYFEITYTTITTAGSNLGCGAGTATSTYQTMAASGTVGAVALRGGGLFSNGSSVGAIGVSFVAGSVAGIAVDLDNRMAWFRKDAAGNWNGSGTANPATNTGGIVVPAGSMVPFVMFGGLGAASGNAFTANFGASAFSGAVPSGFTAGWTA